MRILVIDDDNAVRSAVRRALLLDGYEVLVAASGRDGLEYVGSAVPDAVVLDLGRARIKAIVRRHVEGADGRSLRFGELELDPDAHGARIGGRAIELTRTELRES